MPADKPSKRVDMVDIEDLEAGTPQRRAHSFTFLKSFLRLLRPSCLTIRIACAQALQPGQ